MRVFLIIQPTNRVHLLLHSFINNICITSTSISKADDKKQAKKGEEVIIVVDRSNVESVVSPGAKTDPEFVAVDASRLNDALSGVAADTKEG